MNRLHRAKIAGNHKDEFASEVAEAPVPSGELPTRFRQPGPLAIEDSRYRIKDIGDFEARERRLESDCDFGDGVRLQGLDPCF